MHQLHDFKRAWPLLFFALFGNFNDKNRYIVSARLNGKAYDLNWLQHADLIAGGELELTLGNKPGNWGKTPPPSKSDPDYWLH